MTKDLMPIPPHNPFLAISGSAGLDRLPSRSAGAPELRLANSLSRRLRSERSQPQAGAWAWTATYVIV